MFIENVWHITIVKKADKQDGAREDKARKGDPNQKVPCGKILSLEFLTNPEWPPFLLSVVFYIRRTGVLLLDHELKIREVFVSTLYGKNGYVKSNLNHNLLSDALSHWSII